MPVSRRHFLKTASLAVPSLVIGLELPLGRSAAPPTNARFNAWLTIASDDTVTISLSQAEMGQDVYTTMAMLVAEELEADWSRIRVVPVDADRVYANPTLGVQGTFGSLSVREFNVALRTAGAQAREMLRAAAARSWNVPLESCAAATGHIVHLQDGRKLRYGSLVHRAALAGPPPGVTLKEPKDWVILGKPAHRLDSQSKTDGTAVFGIDVQVPGMLIGTVRACPQLGGKLGELEEAPALAIPGVHSVVKLESAFVVLARDYWSADKGARALRPKWVSGPLANFSTVELRAQLKEKLGQAGLVAVSRGNPAAALASTSRKVEAVYELPYLAHATMEPMSATVSVTSNGVEAWLPTQLPGVHQLALGQIFGFEPDQVRVHTTFLGGGFGRRGELDFALYAAFASKASGRPVKVIWPREEDIQHDFYRPASVGRLRAALDEAGMPIALELRFVLQSIGARLAPPSNAKDGPRMDAGAAPSGPDHPDPFAVAGLTDVAYAIDSWHAEFVEQKSGAPVGAWRSVPNSYNGFFIESFVDEIAHASRHDPFAMRRALLESSARSLAVLDKAASLSGWGRVAAGRSQGMSFWNEAGSMICQVVEISVTRNHRLRLHKITAVVDCGIALNPTGVEAQIQGAILDALSAALYGEITIVNGRVAQSNFHNYRLLRIPDAPVVDVHIIDSGAPLGGIGEVAVPGLAPALTNAIFAATGERICRLPVVSAGGKWQV